MTDTSAVALPSDSVAARRADFIGQATAVEQARAVAEVQAAVIVAQQVPRILSMVVATMRESCAQPGLADRAFYKYPRAGGTVTGPSVHLARELARCFGNCQYGIIEMRRDDVGKFSEMQSWAWDVQTNTRSSNTFVVPHMRDKTGGPVPLTDLRDVYENNANMGARRLREAIFSILPTWYTEEAKDLCIKTMEKSGGTGRSLAQSIADAIAKFDELGVPVSRLEAKLNARSRDWTAHDVAQLRVSFASIRQQTVSVEEEFPPARVTASEIAGAPPTPGTAEPTPPAEPEPPAQPIDPDDPDDAEALEALAEVAGALDVIAGDGTDPDDAEQS